MLGVCNQGNASPCLNEDMFSFPVVQCFLRVLRQMFPWS